jgi:hypothetical protein
VLYLFIVKFLGWIMAYKAEPKAAEPPPLTKDQELLTEIRDQLKNLIPVGQAFQSDTPGTSGSVLPKFAG